MLERTRGSIKPDALLKSQSKSLEGFFGCEALPKPPQEMVEFVERTSAFGFTFEPYLKQSVVFAPDSNFLGWQIRPNKFFWDAIRGGHIFPEAARFNTGWAAIETIRRPNYDRGLQLYENDALAPVLEDLRKRGGIEIPDYVKHVPSISRFGVSPLEIEGPVVSRVAEIAEIDPGKMSAAHYMDFNYIGNLKHPEFGQADTLEWFADPFGQDHRLYGGRSDRGGLACVRYHWAGNHDDRIGFRFQVDFSFSK